ncbi:MAG: LLM class F420-dependent oxidoreductase, partial [Actinomycetota bacterium]|nr:LLM class F420-dependent oxidoreductase [Actinomycetota bacterium]
EAAVPAEFLELTTLCGPQGYVAERIAAFADAGVTHLQVTPLPQGDQTPASLIETLRSML